MKHIKLSAWVLSPGSTLGVVPRPKPILSEYGHVAYRTKGNEMNGNIHAYVLPLHTPLTPGVGSKQIISESGYAAYQFRGNKV